MTASSPPLFARRTLYFLFVGILVGLAAGGLTYLSTKSVAGAASAGVVATGFTIGWLCTLDLPALATKHGCGLVLISLVVAVLLTGLAVLNGVPLPLAVIGAVSLGAAMLVWLQKNAP